MSRYKITFVIAAALSVFFAQQDYAQAFGRANAKVYEGSRAGPLEKSPARTLEKSHAGTLEKSHAAAIEKSNAAIPKNRDVETPKRDDAEPVVYLLNFNNSAVAPGYSGRQSFASGSTGSISSSPIYAYSIGIHRGKDYVQHILNIANPSSSDINLMNLMHNPFDAINGIVIRCKKAAPVYEYKGADGISRVTSTTYYIGEGQPCTLDSVSSLLR